MKYASRYGRGAKFARGKIAAKQREAEAEYQKLFFDVAAKLGHQAAARMRAEVEGEIAAPPAHYPGALGNYLDSLRPNWRAAARGLAELVLKGSFRPTPEIPKSVQDDVVRLATAQREWLESTAAPAPAPEPAATPQVTETPEQRRRRESRGAEAELKRRMAEGDLP